MGVAANVTCAVVLWDRVVKYLNLGGMKKELHLIWDPMSQFADLQRQLGRLRGGLPTHLVFNEANQQSHASEHVGNQFLYLHIIHAQIALTLNHFAIPTLPTTKSPKDMPKQFLAEAARDTLRAAAQISRLLKQANERMFTESLAVCSAYTSSIIHVWGIFAAKNEKTKTSSEEYLRHNYKYLNHMKRYWVMSYYMISVLRTRRMFVHFSRF